MRKSVGLTIHPIPFAWHVRADTVAIPSAVAVAVARHETQRGPACGGEMTTSLFLPQT